MAAPQHSARSGAVKWLAIGMLSGMSIAVLSTYLIARYTIRDWGWAER